MNIPFLTKNRGILLNAMVLITLALTASFVSGQGKEANPSADLDQCRNGSTGTVPCTGSAWVNGNVGAQQGQYSEDEYLPYRMKFTNLVPGTAYVVLLGYDVKNSGRHAIDYLGTYNTQTINRNTNSIVTRPGVDPCSGVSGCTLGSPSDTVLIPADVDAVTSFTNPNIGGPIFQPLNQMFTLWGGSFTNGVAVQKFKYTFLDPMTGSQAERRVAIRFTPTVANPVLAWSGHVGWSGDWGPLQAAGGISGSPYHMRLKGLAALDIDNPSDGGNQDRSLSADAIPASASAFVRKEVFTPNCSDGSPLAFGFTATGFPAFSLTDDVYSPPPFNNPFTCVGNPRTSGPGAPKSVQVQTFDGIANVITVTEGAVSGWTLSDLVCSQTGGTPNNVIDLANRRATVTLEPYEVVTCTFSNTNLTSSAAPASITGRVVTNAGRGISGAQMTLTDAATGEERTITTNVFGYYTFTDVETTMLYTLSVSAKRYRFSNSTITFTLDDNMFGADFVAN